MHSRAHHLQRCRVGFLRHCIHLLKISFSILLMKISFEIYYTTV